MNKRRFLPAVTLLFPLTAAVAIAQPLEGYELSPEALDAAFTEADAAREAAGWSDKTVERRVADPMASMSAAADLVIRARVTAQKVVYDDRDVPFTHTTLGISEVVAGNYQDSHITVVQEGGPDRHDSDRVLMLSHTHYFTPGQEELLFLELNPDSAYPHSQVVINTRFSVLNGQLFNEDGRGLIYTETEEAPGYTLSWSRDRHPHPRFTEFRVGEHEFSKQFREREQESEGPAQLLSRSQIQAGPGYQESVDIGTFKHVLATRKGG